MPDALNGQEQVEVQQQVNVPINVIRQAGDGDPQGGPPPGDPPQQDYVRRRRSKAGRWEMEHSRLMTRMETDVNMTGQAWEQTAETAVQGAEAIVKEFNSRASVGWFSRRKRKKAFKEKMELTSLCRQLQNNNPDPPEQKILNIELISAMMKDDTDYLDYKNDLDFLMKFDENYEKISRFAGMNPDELDTFLTGMKPFLDELGIYYSPKEIKGKAGKFAKVEKFYRAKRDMIASPFYSILTGDDTEKIGDSDLRALSSKNSTVKNGPLKSYLKNIADLRDLKHEGVVRSGWANMEASAVKKVSKKHGGTRGYFKAGNVTAGLKTTLKQGTSHGREYEQYDYHTEQEISHKDLGKKVDAVSAKIEANAEASALEVGFKGGKRHKNGKGSWEGSLTVGHAKVYGNVGGTLAVNTKDKGIAGFVGAEAGAEVAAVKAKIGASYSSHNDMHGVYANAEGQALHANAYALAKYGTFKIPDSTGQGIIEIKDGYALMAGAQAGIAKGSVSGGFKIFGIRIGATLSGSVGGVGGSVGMYKSKGKAGFSFGLSAIVGFKLDLNIDFSYWTERVKKKIVDRVRKGKKKK